MGKLRRKSTVSKKKVNRKEEELIELKLPKMPIMRNIASLRFTYSKGNKALISN